jgi:hypothetical protein
LEEFSLWPDCPEYVEALLEHIESEMDRYYCNQSQKDFPSPFRNTGHDGDFCIPGQLEIYAFEWDEAIFQPFNFKWEDIKIRWYKYLGRDTRINKPISPERAVKMFSSCMKIIRKYYGED